MKAVVYDRYGPPEVLELREVPKPEPKPDEVLVKVHATSVSAGDWRMRKAEPFLARLFNGLFKPTKVRILGFELAGVIEQVGANVKSLKPGDEVFGSCGFKFGCYAEYRCLPENEMVALKPKNMSFEEAATVPIGGITALRFLTSSNLKPNDKIMIYGASGSVGTFGVQLAKAFGAEVTGVCSTSNIELVKSLGAVHVIDYTKSDLKNDTVRYDVVFDAVGKASRSTLRSLLKPGGRYISVWGTPKKQSSNELGQLRELIENGKLRSVIDRRYTLDQIREAHRYVESFRKKGNVAVTIVPDK